MVLLDWTLTKTSGLHDVAYLVSQNVDLEERRANEREIVRALPPRPRRPRCGGLLAGAVLGGYRLVVLRLFAYAVLIAGTLDPSNEHPARRS